MTDQPTPPLHEQVRALEADLAMCREQLAQETERAEKAESLAQLPTPDDTNPAHLRFTSAILRKTKPKDVGERDCSRLAILADAYLANANRLEAAQRQADAEKSLIDKAAQTLSDGCDRGCISLSWDRLPESVREQWRHHARNLLNAGLLKGGGDDADHLEVAQQKADDEGEMEKRVAELLLKHQPSGRSIGGLLAECRCGAAYDSLVVHQAGALRVAGLLQGGDEK